MFLLGKDLNEVKVCIEHSQKETGKIKKEFEVEAGN